MVVNSLIEVLISFFFNFMQYRYTASVEVSISFYFFSISPKF